MRKCSWQATAESITMRRSEPGMRGAAAAAYAQDAYDGEVRKQRRGGVVRAGVRVREVPLTGGKPPSAV